MSSVLGGTIIPVSLWLLSVFIPKDHLVVVGINSGQILHRGDLIATNMTLVGKEIAVELKNDVVLTGTLHSVDQYLNVKLLNVQVVQPEKYPQLTALQNCFIRGSVVRYIQIPPSEVDTELLQDAARKENAPAKKTA